MKPPRTRGRRAGSLRGRHYLKDSDLGREDLFAVIDAARELESRHAAGVRMKVLSGKTLALIFQKPSTRTRVSFDMAMRRLGGDAIFLSGNEIQLGRGETVEDTGRVLSGYVDGIMARVFAHSDLERLASVSCVPVINGLSDSFHPCQILADLLTLQEELGDWRRKKVGRIKLAYLGDGNNVCHSLLLGCALAGVSVAAGCPKGYSPEASVVKEAERLASDSGAEVLVTADPREAVSDARAVYTDVWTSMGQEGQEKARRAKLAPFQVNAALMKQARKDAIFLHCLPAHRDEEVSAEVMDGPQSRVFQQANNRLWAQAGLLSLLL